MKNNVFITVLVLIGLLSFYLIGSGITGLVVWEPVIKRACSADYPCESPEVCCFFYEEQAGVCHLPEMCRTITEITKDQKTKNELLQDIFLEQPSGSTENTMPLTPREVSKPVRSSEDQIVELNFITQIWAGIFILILVIITIFFHVKEDKASEPAKPVKKKRKKKR